MGLQARKVFSIDNEDSRGRTHNHHYTLAHGKPTTALPTATVSDGTTHGNVGCLATLDPGRRIAITRSQQQGSLDSKINPKLLSNFCLLCRPGRSSRQSSNGSRSSTMNCTASEIDGLPSPTIKKLDTKTYYTFPSIREVPSPSSNKKDLNLIPSSSKLTGSQDIGSTLRKQRDLSPFTADEFRVQKRLDNHFGRIFMVMRSHVQYLEYRRTAEYHLPFPTWRI